MNEVKFIKIKKKDIKSGIKVKIKAKKSVKACTQCIQLLGGKMILSTHSCISSAEE